jgi:hypothetical protein
MGKIKQIITGTFGAALVLCVVLNIVYPASTHGEMLERVVAIVNDEVILLSEFKETYRSEKEKDSTVSEETVMNGMVNSILLLDEAKRFSAGDTDIRPKDTVHNRRVVRDYIDRRLRAFIHIPPEDIEYYYRQNKARYEGRDFYDVRNEIEDILTEKEFDARLHEYINQLRAKAYIRIQL